MAMQRVCSGRRLTAICTMLSGANFRVRAKATTCRKKRAQRSKPLRHFVAKHNPMLISKAIAEAQSACAQLRGEGRVVGRTLGLVPTMGALHEGHLSLARAARTACDAVAVSIFVNPTQFGPNEDFSKYPRTFENDCALLEREGVDLIFAPTVEEMYPAGASTFVIVEGVSDRLDGASRPGHFRGVTTVVSKLFHIIEAHKAFFGQKDAAQVAVLRKMVRDLNFPLK